MKALALVVLLGCATEARAQGGAFGSPGGLDVVGYTLDAVLLSTGVGSAGWATWGLAHGERKVGFFILSGVVGAIELLVGGHVVSAAIRPFGSHSPFEVGWGTTHVVLGAINLLVPIAGLIHRLVLGPAPAPVAARVLQGAGPGGSRWAGVGVEVAL